MNRLEIGIQERKAPGFPSKNRNRNTLRDIEQNAKKKVKWKAEDAG